MYNSAFIYFVQTDLFCKEIILLTVALAYFFFLINIQVTVYFHKCDNRNGFNFIRCIISINHHIY